MRVYRGRGDSIEADRAVSDRVVERVAADREPAVRVWRPHPQVAFGRRDARVEGYDRARELADERGFPPVEREVGGRAVAYTGATVAFARVTPVADSRSGLRVRYDAATADLLDALGSLGADAREGEPPDSFCPGTHSVRADCGGRSRKLAGLAQRVRADAAVVAGVLVVRDHAAIASVLDPVYAALDVPFDPGTVGSVARAGGRTDPDAVVDAVAGALVGDAAGDASVQRVG
ncbi:lipoate--protein ligase family protein [Halosimplex rubrum]|uniref:Lipoate--protein ligase family protein n=1 Tax=Halosimplex rubrum TaxID=869889 RepID=A0A7D5SZE9_9EURY|nr:lipoate--protein ligase family protein [Halosimplex rubrum]QLH77068.1 lipoate--protein ligase family protein [Halosimplex rubrum]